MPKIKTPKKVEPLKLKFKLDERPAASTHDDETGDEHIEIDDAPPISSMQPMNLNAADEPQQQQGALVQIQLRRA